MWAALENAFHKSPVVVGSSIIRLRFYFYSNFFLFYFVTIKKPCAIELTTLFEPSDTQVENVTVTYLADYAVAAVDGANTVL
tara:strand:+ start:1816 stop:2061 length:246 start_codon:yes stop_codon:yes gene_type:complete